MASRIPYLDNLPYDCLHEILASLDLPSIKNLRLTSRALRGSCSGGQFEACLRRQTTDLSESSLRSLSSLSSHHEFGPVVRELKICVPLYDESKLQRLLHRVGDPSLQSKVPISEQIEWMRDQRRKQAELPVPFVFDHLASVFASLPHLEMVSLDIMAVRGFPPKHSVSRPESKLYGGEVLPRASQLYRLVISAIIKSDISLTTLNLFTNSIRCGVPLNDLQINTWHYEAEHLGVVTDSIKHFGLKISTAIDSEPPFVQPQGERVKRPGTRPIRSRARKVIKASEEDFQGLMDLLGRLRGLQTFNLSLFSTSIQDRISKSEIFQAIVQRAQLPSLRHCELGGIYVSETHLLEFLENYHHIQELAMDKIVLTSGSWQPIFSHLSKNMPALERLKLSLLFTERGLETLNPIWEDPKQELLYFRQFDGLDLARGLIFRSPGEDAKCPVSPRVFWHAGANYGHS